MGWLGSNFQNEGLFINKHIVRVPLPSLSDNFVETAHNNASFCESGEVSEVSRG